MSVPRYPEYKESGAEWFEQIPMHWSTPPLYLRYEAELGKMLDTSRITGESLLPYLRNVDVQWGRINFDDLPEMDIDPYEISRYTVQSGDLLVCEGGEVGRSAVVGELPGPTAFQKALHRLRAIHPCEVPKYLFYVFQWATEAGVFSNHGQSTIAHLTGEQLRKYRFPCPPRDEQIAIAAFLDHETSKIDALIAEQEKLVTLLAEKRQATISHAVTRGLNPDALMKDSGVAWLGEVPAHWTVGPLKFFVRASNGAIKTGPFGSQLTSAEMEAGIIKVYNQRNVIDNDFLQGENYISEEKFAQLSSFETVPGDVLVTTRGTIGRAAILPATAERGILHPCLLRIQVNNGILDASFLRTLIEESDLLRIQIALFSNATTIEVIYSQTMANLIMPLPPLDEQMKILAFVESEAKKIDTLKSAAERAIDLLKERRSALIAAAVTGQIDVRGVVAQTDEQMEAVAA